MLVCIAKLLEQAISKNLFPVLQDHVVPPKLPGENGDTHKESETGFRSEVSRVMSVQSPGPSGGCTSTSWTARTPSLFQRALTLGSNLDAFGTRVPQQAFSTQAQQRWLRIGGEACLSSLSLSSSPRPSPPNICATNTAEDINSRVHDDVVDIASTVESEQDSHTGVVQSDIGGDIMMLDGPPEDVVFKPQKHILTDAGISKHSTKRVKYTNLEPAGEVTSSAIPHWDILPTETQSSAQQQRESMANTASASLQPPTSIPAGPQEPQLQASQLFSGLIHSPALQHPSNMLTSSVHRRGIIPFTADLSGSKLTTAPTIRFNTCTENWEPLVSKSLSVLPTTEAQGLGLVRSPNPMSHQSLSSVGPRPGPRGSLLSHEEVEARNITGKESDCLCLQNLQHHEPGLYEEDHLKGQAASQTEVGESQGN